MANLGIDKLRLRCRLAKDLGHLDQRRYENAARWPLAALVRPRDRAG